MTSQSTQTAHALSTGGFELICPLAEIGRDDVRIAGDKGANIGELIRAGLRAPDGFVITSHAYVEALAASGVRDALLTRLAASNGYGHDKRTSQWSESRELEEMHAIASGITIPQRLREAIAVAYGELGDNTRVAVRASASAELSARSSFAGIYDSYTNVSGLTAVLERVRGCWASVFSERAILYRKLQGLRQEPHIAVVVQRMVDADSSGVVFTVDPVTGHADTLVIEAAFGLGRAVVDGLVDVDSYRVDRRTKTVREAHIGNKAFKIVHDLSGYEQQVALSSGEATARVLTDPDATLIARLALQVEAHYGRPQDVEWVLNASGVSLVQTRPITTLKTRASVPVMGHPLRIG